MQERYQSDALTLIRQLLALSLQPPAIAAALFMAGRPIPDVWMQGLASAGAMWTGVLAVIGLSLVDEHIEMVCARLADRLLTGTRYGLSQRSLRRTFSRIKLITLSLPIMGMFFVGVIFAPAGIAAVNNAGLWFAHTFAVSSWILTAWTALAMGRCNFYSWRVVVTRRSRVGSEPISEQPGIEMPRWMVRVESVAWCCVIGTAILAAIIATDTITLAAIAAVANAGYYAAFHIFLDRGYKTHGPGGSRAPQRPVATTTDPVVSIRVKVPLSNDGAAPEGETIAHTPFD
jgi:hypothetical protein